MASVCSGRPSPSSASEACAQAGHSRCARSLQGGRAQPAVRGAGWSLPPLRVHEFRESPRGAVLPDRGRVLDLQLSQDWVVTCLQSAGAVRGGTGMVRRFSAHRSCPARLSTACVTPGSRLLRFAPPLPQRRPSRKAWPEAMNLWAANPSSPCPYTLRYFYSFGTRTSGAPWEWKSRVHGRETRPCGIAGPPLDSGRGGRLVVRHSLLWPMLFSLHIRKQRCLCGSHFHSLCSIPRFSLALCGPASCAADDMYLAVGEPMPPGSRTRAPSGSGVLAGHGFHLRG
jgi:hypothetical protein